MSVFAAGVRHKGIDLYIVPCGSGNLDPRCPPPMHLEQCHLAVVGMKSADVTIFAEIISLTAQICKI